MATARRRVDEVNGHRSFVKGLLRTLARGQRQAGAQQSGQAEGTATALQNVPSRGEAAHQSAALQARWAMGRDSAAYLRTDVVPLQSSGTDENAVHPDVVTNGIYPEVERAGRVGMLEHMGAELERRRTTLIGELVQHTQLIGYLLQIDEVRDAVKWRLLTMASLDAEAGAQALQCLLSVTENRGGNVAVQTLSDFARRPVQVDAQETEQRQAQRKAIRLLAQELLVLGAPLAEAERQLERTLHGEWAPGTGCAGWRQSAASTSPPRTRCSVVPSASYRRSLDCFRSLTDPSAPSAVLHARRDMARQPTPHDLPRQAAEFHPRDGGRRRQQHRRETGGCTADLC